MEGSADRTIKAPLPAPGPGFFVLFFSSFLFFFATFLFFSPIVFPGPFWPPPPPSGRLPLPLAASPVGTYHL